MICHRCGKCCYFSLRDGTIKKCKYLVQGKICSCRIYNDPGRINKLIYSDKDNKIYCVPVALVECKYKK